MHFTNYIGCDTIREYLAYKNGQEIKVIGMFFGIYLPKFWLNKNLLIKNIVSENGDPVSDHMFVTINNFTFVENGLHRGDLVIVEGTIYKYKKTRLSSRKLETDFSITASSIKKYHK